MTQKITVTKTEDHYEMQFEGNDTAYPVPTSAIDKLDDKLTPDESGDSITFIGEYGGHKHMKNFDVEEVLDAPANDGSDEVDEIGAEPTDEHVEEQGYNNAAGQAQQAEADRIYSGESNGAEANNSQRIMTDGGDERTECVHCETLHTPEAGIVTGKPEVGDDRTCNICLQDHLREHTVLSRRESEVAALKLLGYRHESIAELLQTWRGEEKPTKSTVDEYSSRMQKKVGKAAETVNSLERYL